jgi:hypothetical protein
MTMTTKMTLMKRYPLHVCALAGAVALLASCQEMSTIVGTGSGVTASEAKQDTHSGFLSDYSRLRAVVGDEGAKCWRQPDVNWKQYDKVLITRMVVTLKPGQNKAIDPSDLKSLVDYFHGSLVRALKPQMQIVDKPGPGVIVMSIALTDLVPTAVYDSLIGTAVPYGFVAEEASGVSTGRPAGSTPYLGQTGIEMRLTDGASKAILAECEDTEIGRKYATDLNAGAQGAATTWMAGYMNSFSSWTYAKDAFDKWSALLAQRFAVLRGVKPPPR